MTKRCEVRRIRDRTGVRRGSVEEHTAKVLTVSVPPDEVAYVVAGGSVAAIADLFVDVGLEFVRERHVHRRHDLGVSRLGKFCHQLGGA